MPTNHLTRIRLYSLPLTLKDSSDMKKTVTSFLLFFYIGCFGQIPAYYASVDFTLTELALKAELAELITSTHTYTTSYSEVWAVLQSSDLDPTNGAVVLLMYGYNDDDASVINDRTRDKDNYGGSTGQWNREHVFPKSLGSPDLGTSGPGSDPHNLRSSDVQMNGNRGNKMYAAGTGDAGSIGSNWYPGDEWKGDAARIIMYMYLRYGNRCLPSNVTVGSANAIDPGMIDLLLDWNASDEVSTFEINRNNAIYAVLGNRNPFIDNPRIANSIWAGTLAEDTWGGLGVSTVDAEFEVELYPNPVLSNSFFVRSTALDAIEGLVIYNAQGQIVEFDSSIINSTHCAVDVNNWSSGIYYVQVQCNQTVKTHKIIIQ